MAATGKRCVRAETAESVHHHVSWLTAHSRLELTSQIRKSKTRTRTVLVWQTCSQEDKKTRSSTSYYNSFQLVSSANQTAGGGRQQTLQPCQANLVTCCLSLFYYTVSIGPGLAKASIYRLTSPLLWAAMRLTWRKTLNWQTKVTWLDVWRKCLFVLLPWSHAPRFFLCGGLMWTYGLM